MEYDLLLGTVFENDLKENQIFNFPSITLRLQSGSIRIKPTGPYKRVLNCRALLLIHCSHLNLTCNIKIWLPTSNIHFQCQNLTYDKIFDSRVVSIQIFSENFLDNSAIWLRTVRQIFWRKYSQKKRNTFSSLTSEKSEE